MKEYKKLVQCKLNVTTELVRTPVDATIPRLIADLDITVASFYNASAVQLKSYRYSQSIAIASC